MGIINSRHLNLQARKQEFIAAFPFPHIVLDDFLEADILEDLKSISENTNAAVGGKTFSSAVERKKWISLNSVLPDPIKQVVDALNTEAWVKNMIDLTGIASLVSTSNGNTKLANYHVMEPGGELGSHVDHSYEPTLGIPHVLNVIVYLSENWEENAGGATLFYDQKGKNIISRIAYRPNRAVLFLHSPYTFHGVEKVSENARFKRKTVYVDYYSQSYQPYDGMKLNFDLNWFKHGTTFKLNNYLDYLKPENRQYAKALLQYQLNKLIKKS